MKIFRTTFCILHFAFCIFLIGCTQNAQLDVTSAQEKYTEMQHNIARGWNTWDTRSVLRHVLLPHGVAVDIHFATPDGKRVDRFFIGDRKEGSAQMR
ncbi:MAG: hypothetical protein LBG15_16450, partial [Dysgonamonadaceae bacterium]|nr:hypothetical protein [Dysgonamonadaceae bacterium]